MKPSLEIVIVNWNAGRHLSDCLNSIRSTKRDGFEIERVVVVDNASADGSVDNIHFPDLPLDLIKNPENRGFAVACNQGARVSASDYVLFLNPDMRLLFDSLQVPMQFMEDPENAKMGICGIQLLDEVSNVSQSSSRFPSVTGLLSQMLGLDRIFPGHFKGHFLGLQDHLKSGQVDQVMGAFFMVRRKLFESLGGFDERFFVYFEDVDFSFRARQKSWRSYYLVTTQAWHKGGGCSSQAKARRLYYTLCSRILYCRKHFGRASATVVVLGTLLLEPGSRLILAAGHKSVLEIRETLRAYLMLWRALPTLLRKRHSKDGHNQLSPEPVTSVPAD